MAEAVTETNNRGQWSDGLPDLPAEVKLWAEDLKASAFTPRQLRMIRETFGRSIGELSEAGAAAFDEILTVRAWLKLQEQFGPFPVDLMDDVTIRPQLDADGKPLANPDPPDPTGGVSSSSSSASAASGP